MPWPGPAFTEAEPDNVKPEMTLVSQDNNQSTRGDDVWSRPHSGADVMCGPVDNPNVVR